MVETTKVSSSYIWLCRRKGSSEQGGEVLNNLRKDKVTVSRLSVNVDIRGAAVGAQESSEERSLKVEGVCQVEVRGI